MIHPKPFLLMILDGFGYREATQANAIASAHMPNWKQYWQQYPHLVIAGSGRCVGLPDGQMGNSEVGHLTIGAGRVISQDLTRIDEAIRNHEFFKHPLLKEIAKNCYNTNKKIHLLGLFSPGGVHSHQNHFLAVIDFFEQSFAQNIFVHAFLDGRDTPPKSALDSSLLFVDEKLRHKKLGKIASIIGRFYAMDRDKRYDRTEKAYNLLTQTEATFTFGTVKEAIEQAYARGETDEFIQATKIAEKNEIPVTIQEDDVVIFMNFRADRSRQLSYALTQEHFSGFQRKSKPQLSQFITLTQYANDLPAKIIFPSVPIRNSLGEYLSYLGLKQLRIAETEKYAHVTFFFNGGIEKSYDGEERILIPSPPVKTYDLKPEMSAFELTNALITAIQSQQYDVIICNFANPDMVGHTGNFQATVQALEVIDQCLGKIVIALQKVGGELLVSADHGNAEYMYDEETQQAHTAHTSEPVPLLYIGRPAEVTAHSGQLSDIAPSLLALMGLPIPNDMTGRALFKIAEPLPLTGKK